MKLIRIGLFVIVAFAVLSHGAVEPWVVTIDEERTMRRNDYLVLFSNLKQHRPQLVDRARMQMGLGLLDREHDLLALRTALRSVPHQA